MIDESIIRQWWDLLQNNDCPTEIRILKDSKIFTGYFKNVENLLRCLVPFKDNASIYATLNPCVEDVWGRLQGDQIISTTKDTPTTSGNDIAGRDYILIDLDPKRSSHVEASDAEKQYAYEKSCQVFRYLRNMGLYDPIFADSGNGYHMYYRVKLQNNNENTELVKRFLSVLDMFFSDEKCHVDTGVYDPNRIVKVIGTMSKKGRHLKERPHRLSKFVYIPEDFKVNDRAFIEKVANEYPQEVKPDRHNNYNAEPFDLDEFISKHGIEVVKRTTSDGVEKIILKECPFNHTHKQAAIFRMSNGAIAFKCFHNSCQQYHWKDVRLKYDPLAYDKKDRREWDNRHRWDRPRPQAPEIKKEDEKIGVKWLDPKDIKYVDPRKFPYIPTGIEKLDSKMLGLTLGDVTIVSGLAGSGKSSLLNLLMLNAVEKGFKVAAWSGELQDHRIISWIDQMAAGKARVVPQPGYDNIYHASRPVALSINNWLSGKLWIYNNAYGNRWSQLINDIREMLEKEHPQLIVVDNLTALTLDTEGIDKNDQQKSFINEIKTLAKEKEIHIILVCHPRKEVNFQLLRMESISGSSDLINLCDNVLIVHRKGTDLERRLKQFFGDNTAIEYSQYDTLIEICKNRSHGRVNTLIGMYFEPETRRFLNHISENKIYGWDNSVPQIMKLDFPSNEAWEDDDDLPE